MLKPNLYCFGDSFVQWPEPVDKHWTDLFRDEYEVHRLGKNGASNEHIIFQLGNLPKYKSGDRVVIVLTDLARIPKWYWGEHYGEFTSSNPNAKNGVGTTTSSTVEELEKLMIRKSMLLKPLTENDSELNMVKVNKHHKDTPIELFNLVDNLSNILSDFNPVIVSWSEYTFELLKSKIHPLPQGMWTSLNQEGIVTDRSDYHPGIEGCRFWHENIKSFLDNSC